MESIVNRCTSSMISKYRYVFNHWCFVTRVCRELSLICEITIGSITQWRQNFGSFIGIVITHRMFCFRNFRSCICLFTPAAIHTVSVPFRHSVQRSSCLNNSTNYKIMLCRNQISHQLVWCVSQFQPSIFDQTARTSASIRFIITVLYTIIHCTVYCDLLLERRRLEVCHESMTLHAAAKISPIRDLLCASSNSASKKKLLKARKTTPTHKMR